jgi:hypothetical protein
MHLRRHITLGAALMIIAVGSVQACPNHASKTATTVAPRSLSRAPAAALLAWKPRAWAPALLAAPRAQGLRVAIDPVDGTMGMPSGDEWSQQLVIGDGSTGLGEAPVRVDRAANGTLTAHLDERWAEFAVATIGPDGKPGWTCVEGARGAVRFMKKPVAPVLPAAPVWEDK